MAGTERRKGSTIQLVMANTNGANGLPARADIFMRMRCMYMRNKQVPATKPTAT